MSGQLSSNVIALLEQSLGHVPTSQNVKAHISKLPPTPPSLRQRPGDSTPSTSFPQRAHISFDPSSPPTPDDTPPSGPRKRNATSSRPPMPRFPSSYADSFVTAREYSSHLSTQSSCSKQDDAITSDLEETTDSDLTPIGDRNRNTYFQHALNIIDEYPVKSDTRNATKVRRKRRVSDLINDPYNGQQISKPRHVLFLQTDENGQLTKDASVKEAQVAPLSVNHRYSLPAALPSPLDNSQEDDWATTTINDMLYRALRDEKAKRLSATSQTSAPIMTPTMIASNPHRKPPTLRHAGKNLALRNHVPRHSSSPIVATATRQQPVLRRKRAQLLNGYAESRSVSDPESSIADQERASDASEKFLSRLSAVTIAHDGRENHGYVSSRHGNNPATSTLRSRHVSAPLPSTTPTFGIKDGPIKEGLPISGVHDLNLGLLPLQRRSSPDQIEPLPYLESIQSTPDTTDTIHEQPMSEQNAELTAHHSAQSKVADGHPLSPQTTASLSQFSALTDTVDFIEAKTVNLFHHGSSSVMVVQHAPHSQTESQCTGALHFPVISKGDNSPTDNMPHPPLDHSQFSAMVEPPSARPSTSEYATLKPDPSKSQACSMPPWSGPPALSIIPPTPSPELHKATSPLPLIPERSSSLFQQARRYSDTIIQPFLSPIRRSSSSSYSSTESPSLRHEEDPDATLHPFWQPRRLWDDDISSSDSDPEDCYYYDEDAFDPERSDRLPPGGDTSSVDSLHARRIRRRGGLFARIMPRMMTSRMTGYLHENSGADRGRSVEQKKMARRNVRSGGRKMLSPGLVTLFSASSGARTERVSQQMQTQKQKQQQEQKQKQQQRRRRSKSGSDAGSSSGGSIAGRNGSVNTTQMGSDSDEFALPFFASNRKASLDSRGRQIGLRSSQRRLNHSRR